MSRPKREKGSTHMTRSRMTAARELAGVELPGITRGAFVLRGALVASALYGADAAGSFVSGAFAQSSGAAGGDLEILNFALTLEQLEAAFYRTALAKLKLPADVRRLATELGDHENQHVTALTQAITQLGGQPPAAPKVTFPLKDAASFLKLAQTLEDTGVAAYNGAAPSIQSPDLLAAAGSIVQVEGRHAAAIRLKNRAVPAPNPLDRSLTKAQVLTAVKPFVH